jgi:pseudouridine-5'-phosphate glycosidase
VFRAHRRLGLPGGLLIACPPPAGGPDAVRLEEATARAVREAEEAGVRGGAVTPWLLNRVAELTDGASLEANVGLLVNNARTAAEIAVADAAL